MAFCSVLIIDSCDLSSVKKTLMPGKLLLQTDVVVVLWLFSYASFSV